MAIEVIFSPITEAYGMLGLSTEPGRYFRRTVAVQWRFCTCYDLRGPTVESVRNLTDLYLDVVARLTETVALDVIAIQDDEQTVYRKIGGTLVRQ